jgi:hypothetical protein
MLVFPQMRELTMAKIKINKNRQSHGVNSLFLREIGVQTGQDLHLAFHRRKARQLSRPLTNLEHEPLAENMSRSHRGQRCFIASTAHLNSL